MKEFYFILIIVVLILLSGREIRSDLDFIKCHFGFCETNGFLENINERRLSLQFWTQEITV